MVDEKGNTQTDTDSLLKTTEEYYKKLFTPTKVNHAKPRQLLRNIINKVSKEDREFLDKTLTNKELEDVVKNLLKNKSPGIDGFTAEFYQKFWYLLKDKYLVYLNVVTLKTLP